jgi:hypothetical protein
MGQKRNSCRVLVGKSQRKSSLGRLTRRWDDKIKIYLKEIGAKNVDWVYLAQYRGKCWDFF